MIATYVARVALENKGDLSRVEEILNTESFSEPHIYAVASSPIVMLVSPYTDEQGREVRSFELTKHLVECGLLPEDPKKQGPVTKEMANALLGKLEEQSSRVELYRVSATDVTSKQHQFFLPYPDLEGRGSGPFVPHTLGRDMRKAYTTKSGMHLFSQG